MDSKTGSILKNKFFIFVVLIFGAGLIALFKFGIRPKPVPKINLSGFASATDYTKAIELRLNLELNKTKVLVLGIAPNNPDHELLAKQSLPILIKAFGFNVIYNEQGVIPNWDLNQELKNMSDSNSNSPLPEIQIHNIRFYESLESNLESIKSDFQQGKKVLILTANLFSTTKIQKSIPNLLIEKSVTDITSFFTSTFPKKRDEEKDIPLQCQVEGVDQTGLGALSCLILQRARSIYRKQLDPSSTGDYLGIVDQVGLQDYVLMFRHK